MSDNLCRQIQGQSRNPEKPWSSLISGFLLMLLVAPATLAQTANFGALTLGAGKVSGALSGSTGGGASLPAIVSNRDRHNNQCLGFGSPTPDHILILQQDMATLRLKLDSGGSDTTLVVRGSDGSIRCGDDTSPTNKDASIIDTDWKAATYEIWVGSTSPGLRRDYTLYIRP